MESQSLETPQPDDTPSEFRSPLFRAAPAPAGRPPSSTSTSAPLSPSDSPSSSPLPAESSTSAAPSSSTAPHGVESAAAPAQSPAGSSPSEKEGHSLRETVAHTLTTATQIAHNTLTDDIGRAHSLFLATEGEVESVADGAASILNRRLPSALGSSETGDIVQIVLAVVSYGTRTFQTWKTARAARTAAALAAAQQPTPAAV